MTTVEAQLEQARKSLLDLSLRNKLLNFKEYKRSTAEIVDEVPDVVYENLVVDERDMTFRAGDEHPDHETLEERAEEDTIRVEEDEYSCLLCGMEDSDPFTSRGAIVDHLNSNHQVRIEGQDTENHSTAELENLWELPEDASQDRHTDRVLQTPHTESNLQKRLYHINNRAEALIQDAGYNALHLGTGFLEWTEAESQKDAHRAPLILLPVELERDGAQSSFTIRWNGEEVIGNKTLDLKLEEQGVDLPGFDTPEDPGGVSAYFEAVESACEEFEDWQVIPEMHIGFFDFTKFIMYQDLDPEGWEEGASPADHPLIRGLLGTDDPLDQPEPFDPEAIDDELEPRDVHHVLDADPSQIAAIEDVKRGRDLVIEGPPGTGKSQTIVNMIAELLADDRSVLFVSEKLAALDVVKERLSSVNVGDFCLELHSDKASKSDFLEELERLATLDTYDPEYSSDVFDRLNERTRRLNAYAEALGTPFGALNRTPYSMYGVREEASQHFVDQDRELPRVTIENPAEITSEQYQRAQSELEALAARMRYVSPIQSNPWYGCAPGQVLPQDRRDIESNLESGLDALGNLLKVKSTLESECHVHEARSLSGLRDAIAAAETLSESEPVDARLLRNSTWNTPPADAEAIVELVREYDSISDVTERTSRSHVDMPLPELLTEYRALDSKYSRYIRPRWYRLVRRLDTLYDGDLPEDGDKISADLEALIEVKKLEGEIEEVDERARDLFGSLWQETNTDPDRLESFSEWVVRFRQHLVNDALEDEAIDLVTRNVPESELNETIKRTRAALDRFEGGFKPLMEALGVDASIVFGTSLEDTEFQTIESTLREYLDEIDQLERWSQFDQTRQAVEDTVAEPILEPIHADRLEPPDVIPCSEGNLADALLDAAFRAREPLANFDGEVHQERIDSFQELDERAIEINRERLFAKLVDRAPRLLQSASRSSPHGILAHEFGKERMHKPIRVLLDDAGELIQQMKPCFMMSPRSVAKYLDPGGLDFDVVIFDEASQVRPADALGTILRGDQIVVLGDTKQLPPTGFFDQVVEERDSDDEWKFSVQDVESVLDLCRSAFPAKRLKWHYRSQHESLIAVSNQEFYDNDLLVYPSPVQDAEELGLNFVHLPDTVYDRGGSSVNRQEARRVAQEAVDHYLEHPEQSLGVGTFSQNQQEAVLEEIELLRKENPEVDEYFSTDREESFFVKNLERIQGDERDVIFISVGYGYDADGGFSHNFGPLNHDGGWRRLNVLITRARQRCVVFSNFTADSLDMSATNARGVRSLKVFLDYAQNRDLSTITDQGGDPDSPFERGVIQFLRKEGYEVHPQVGCAGFRIDLAIPDPENPGRYVLGIECDGAAYHSTQVARARDRQREAVLEDRGWEIHRIWSTDWYRDETRTKQRLLDAVERAIERGHLHITDPGGEDGAEHDNSGPSLEEVQSTDGGRSLADLSESYEKATSVRSVALGDHRVSSVARAVKSIAEVEAPIHEDVLADRLVEHSDVTRKGKKIQRTIDKGIRKAARSGEVIYDDPIVHYSDTKYERVRRDRDHGIDKIPPAEIQCAIRRNLEHQYAIEQEDLINQTARLLGFDRTGQRISKRIGSVIGGMLSANMIVKRNGRLELPEE